MRSDTEEVDCHVHAHVFTQRNAETGDRHLFIEVEGPGVDVVASAFDRLENVWHNFAEQLGSNVERYVEHVAQHFSDCPDCGGMA